MTLELLNELPLDALLAGQAPIGAPVSELVVVCDCEDDRTVRLFRRHTPSNDDSDLELARQTYNDARAVMTHMLETIDRGRRLAA